MGFEITRVPDLPNQLTKPVDCHRELTSLIFYNSLQQPHLSIIYTRQTSVMTVLPLKPKITYFFRHLLMLCNQSKIMQNGKKENQEDID